MALPERKRRGRYNQYLEEGNPLGKMPRRTGYRFNKALLAITASSAILTEVILRKILNILGQWQAYRLLSWRHLGSQHP